MTEEQDTNKKTVGLRIAPPTLAMVDELVSWLSAPSKTWIWEAAIIRWHAQEQARQRTAGFLTIEQAAERLGWTGLQVRAAIDMGELYAEQIGERQTYLIQPGDLARIKDQPPPVGIGT